MNHSFFNKIVSVLIFIFLTWAASIAGSLPWYYFVRTSGHPLNEHNIDSIVADAQNSHLFGIEVDNDITGRYDSFLHPEKKLTVLKKLAQKVHAIHNYAFVYIAGLECITPNAEQRQHTFFKDHPDWLQRDINGRPALFSSKDAFWIHEGDEDVWISPFAQPWRKMYMERVRQIAATGIDGIYVDIPYWMTHFEGWENTWASFDDYTVQAFLQQTGLNARTDLRLGDFSDPNFRQWVDFRMKAIEDFLTEIKRNIKSVNPECLLIAEIYPGIDFEAVRVGADVSRLYRVVDVITHEYSQGAYMAASREPFDWNRYMVGMLTFRALANNKPSWMLSYSWDGEQHVKPSEAMRLLFLSQLFAGANPWDAATHVMSGSNDYAQRKRIFSWIARYQEHFFGPYHSKSPIGLYFSRNTRNYFAQDYTPSFMGMVLLFLHTHHHFQIVHQNSLKKFKGSLLILPNVKMLSAKEVRALQKLQQKGVTVLVAQKMESDQEPANIQASLKKLNPQQLTIWGSNIGQQYFKQASVTFNAIAQQSEASSSLQARAKQLMDSLLHFARFEPMVKIKAPITVAVNVSEHQGKMHLSFINLTGIKGKQKLVPRPVFKVTLEIAKSLLRSNQLRFLKYLGDSKIIKASDTGGYWRWELPPILDGAFLWEN